MLEVGKGLENTSTSNNYLEVLVNDEKATLEQLNKLCDTKHDTKEEITYGNIRCGICR